MDILLSVSLFFSRITHKIPSLDRFHNRSGHSVVIIVLEVSLVAPVGILNLYG